MRRRPPVSTRTDTLFPYTPLFRSTMPGGLIAEIIAGRWRDPDGGGRVSVPVRAVAIEKTLAGSEAELVGGLGLGRRLAVVSDPATRSEEHTSELQSLMRISYAVFCLKKNTKQEKNIVDSSEK